jgi:tetratricopeptide (TPR) repeat protein
MSQESEFRSKAGLPDIDSLWTYDDPAAAERTFEGLLARAREAGNDDYLAQLLTQLARAQVLQRRYETGHATLDQAAQLLSEQTPTANVRHLLERGRAWNDSGRPEDAKRAFVQAHRLAVDGQMDVLAVDAAHMLGVMEPFDEAARWNLHAIEIAEGSQEARARSWIGTLFINLGWNYQRLGDYAASERSFMQAVPVLEKDGKLARARVARLCMAKNQRLRGDAAGALAVQERLLHEISAAEEHDGYVLEEIAECLLMLGRSDEAKVHFGRAYQSLSTYAWFPPNEAARLDRLKQLGGLAE